MDWLIYRLVSDVFIHYWYGVQCKIFGYIKNKNVKKLLLMLCFEPMTSCPLMFCCTHMEMTVLSWHLAIIHPRSRLCMPRVWNGPNVTTHLQHKGLFASML